ncbi:MAG: hypothetical protein ACKVIG_07160 [Flavobacteriales bacterium]
MKFKQHLPILRNNNLILFAIIALGCFLFKSYAHQNNYVKGEISYAPKATIIAENTEVCAREFMIITFEGSEGTAPYIFSYTINRGCSTNHNL